MIDFSEHDHRPTTPNFQQLHAGESHHIARHDINMKLRKMAAVELGIATLERWPVAADERWENVDPHEYRPPFVDLPRGQTSFRKPGDVSHPEDPRQMPDVRSLETGWINRDPRGYPLNPLGPTGMAGRGMLDKWGPTHAADPIVTRRHPETGQVEVLLIRRGDTEEWALPGGKVDNGETPWQAAARELAEEAGVTGLDFSGAHVVYAGYVDDSRNTDNAWMETTALHCHVDERQANSLTVRAGSDATAAAWVPATEQLYATLFAGQGDYLRLAVAALA